MTTFPTTCYIYLCINALQSRNLEYKSWRLLYIAEYKTDRWSTILLLAWSCGRIMVAMLGAVKKRAENGIFQWNAKNGVTALQYNNITVLKNQNQNFEPKFYIYNIYIYIYIYLYISYICYILKIDFFSLWGAIYLLYGNCYLLSVICYFRHKVNSFHRSPV